MLSMLDPSRDPEQLASPPLSECGKMTKSNGADLCGTPMSQVTTAPPTPALAPLPGPLGRFCRLTSDFSSSEEHQEYQKITEDLLSELGESAEENCEVRIDVVEDSTEEGEEGVEEEEEDDFIRAMSGNNDEPEVSLCVGLPPLLSELARWAKAEIQEFEAEAERLAALSRADEADDEEEEEDDFIRAMADVSSELSETEAAPEPAILCVGMPPLRSELALWAQAEDEKEMQEDAQHMAGMTTAASSDMEDEDEDEDVDDFIRAMEEVDADNSTGMSSEPAVLCLGMPPLQSELALLAAAQIQQELAKEAERLRDIKESGSEAEEEEEEEEEDDWIQAMRGEDVNYDMDIGDVEPAVLCIGRPPLQSELALWAKEEIEQEEREQKECQALKIDLCDEVIAEDEEEEDDWIRAMRGDGLEDRMDLGDVEPAILGIGLPPLQSELSLWAKAAIEREEREQLEAQALKLDLWDEINAEDEEEEDDWIRAMHDEIALEPPVRCIGMPRLQSELGQWAKGEVERVQMFELKLDADIGAMKANMDEHSDGNGYSLQSFFTWFANCCSLREKEA